MFGWLDLRFFDSLPLPDESIFGFTFELSSKILNLPELEMDGNEERNRPNRVYGNDWTAKRALYDYYVSVFHPVQC